MNRTLVINANRFPSMSWKVPLAFLLLLALFIVIATANGIAPMLWVAAPFAIAGFIAAAWYYPELFLVAAVFVSQWKSAWPFSLFDASGYLTVVMLVGLALGLLFLCFRIALGSERWTFEGIFFRQKHVVLLFVLFVLVLGLSYSYTDAPSYGLTKFARVAFIGGLLLLSPLLLFRSERVFKRFTQLFVAFGFISAIHMIVGLETRSTNAATTDITRIGEGWLVGMTLLLLLFYPVLNDRGFQKLCFAVALPVLAAGMVASAARGGLVAFALLLPFAIFVGPKQRRRGMLLMVIVLGVCSVVAFELLRSADPDKYGSKVNEIVAMSQGQSTSGSAGKRLDFYRQTLDAIPEHLFLGKGVGSWSVFYFGNDERSYPHNLFLEITFEEGLVGFAVFALFLIAVGTASYNTYLVSGRHFSVVGLLVLYSLFVGMFSGDLDDNRLLWLWAGVVLAVCRNVFLARVQPAKYMRFDYAKDANFPKHGWPKTPYPKTGFAVERKPRFSRTKSDLSSPA